MVQREATDAPWFRGGVLADEMGLGKTWMTLGLLLNSVVPNTLLLVPPVLQPQWTDALKAADIPHRILGPPSAKGAGGSWRTVEGTRDFSVTLATFERASRNTVLLSDTDFDRIVCDEGHVFRNGASTIRFRKLSAVVAPRRWILSGTPVQNCRNDFRNLLLFLGINDEDRIRTPLATIGADVILRRTVDDVRAAVPTMPTATPTHVVHPVVMPMGGEEQAVFQALVGRFEHAIEVHASSMIILELYLRIRQFLAHPDLYVDAMRRKYKDKYNREAWAGTASKMESFRSMVSTGLREPTIVFTTFKQEMDLAKMHLRQAGYTVWSIGGGMSDAQREAVTTDSATAAAQGAPVAIVIQIVAGGAGLNLQHCSRVIFLSSHWNPAVVDQAIARAYRMGQTKPVTVHHFLMADNAERNIDRVMARLHGTKRSTALGIHPKLFCDSAMNVELAIQNLDDAIEA